MADLPHAKDWAAQSMINLQQPTLSSNTHGSRAHAANHDQISLYLVCGVPDPSDDVARRSKEVYGASE
jgi:hypothetical protein